jgi:hypothetical protein
MRGSKSQHKIKYVLNLAGNRELAVENNPTFREMDVAVSVRQLAIPGAEDKRTPFDKQPEIELPLNKYVVVRSLLNEKPTDLQSVPVDGQFLTTTLQVEADFHFRKMTVQFPRSDWLDTEQGEDWEGKLASTLNFVKGKTATAHVVVKLSAKSKAEMDKKERRELKLMAAMCEELGLDRQVVLDMADSIFRAWAPYRDT